MIRRVVVLAYAQADLNAGRLFYEGQEIGLGVRFFESLGENLRSLLIHGGSHRRQYGYHRAVAKRFPYAIFYRLDGDTVFVDAVLDCRRDPREIRRRLRG